MSSLDKIVNKDHCYQIVADENMLAVEDIFAPLGQVKLLPGRAISKKDLMNCELLLLRSVTQVNAALLDNTPVKVVASATAGLDHIDEAYLKNKSIFLADAKGANASAVAEYVIASLASLSLHKHENLFAKKIAVVGYGYVGKALVSKLKAFETEVCIYDPLLAMQKPVDGEVKFCSWRDVQQCDVISFHVPFTKQNSSTFPTEHLVDKKFLCNIKKDCVLINASRGDICDEQALLDCLKNNRDIKLVLDVWKNEPLISKSLLSTVFIGSAHIAGYSQDAKIRANELIFSKITAYLNLDFPEKIINKTRNKISLDVEIEKNVSKDDFYFSDCYRVFKTICGIYNPVDEYQKLLPLLDLPEKAAANYFDDLRKNYVHRMEWENFNLNAELYNDAQIVILKSLGFSFGDQDGN